MKALFKTLNATQTPRYVWVRQIGAAQRPSSRIMPIQILQRIFCNLINLFFTSLFILKQELVLKVCLNRKKRLYYY